MPEPEQDGTQALQERQRVRSLRTSSFALLALALGWLHAGAASAQEPTRALPPDTFRDEATRELVGRAVLAREGQAEGIRSYEATLRQRMYVGVTAWRFRRERSLFEHERVARIRWTDAGEQQIQWIGARTAVPIIGIDSGDPDRGDASDGAVRVRVGDDDRRRARRGDDATDDDEREPLDTAEDYLDETDFPGFDFDPGADRLRFGEEWAFHPLADTALVHYRYAPGDTLRVALPSIDREIVLYEVLVEPRRADFQLVAGSLWLDSASASLVRATYRPARPWSMRVDEPDAADEVPGFVGPIEAEIRYITVESSLHELEYWLPRRFAFQGEGRAGSLFRIPMTLEWSVGGYLVNEEPFDILVDGELPEGWRREVWVEADDDGNDVTYTVVVPTTEELTEALALSPDFGRRTPVTFTDAEIEELEGELAGLVPTYQRFRPRLMWGLEQGLLRFNRVEGLSVGGATSLALRSDLYLDVSARIGTGDREPNVSGGLRWGPETSEWTVQGFHRLASMNDRDDPFTLVNTLKNVGLGGDRGEYYRATGASLGYRRRGTSVRTRLEGFHERQRPVEVTTDFALWGLLQGRRVEAALAADTVDVSGGRVGLAWFAGTDPAGWVHTGEVAGEAGFGDATYQRAEGRLSLAHPLFLGLAAAVEVAAGTSWGEVPLQRSFFLGSSRTLRGFYVNELFGTSYWRGRGEVATAFAGARIGVFTDLGWVGEPDSFSLDRVPLLSVGAGASFLDGLIRLDVARALRGSDRWKVHLYLDGLF